MREVVKLSFRLFLFAVVAAVALAATNEITKGPIEEQAIARANAAREQVLPGMDVYEPTEVKNEAYYPGITAVHEVKKDGELTGYTFAVKVTGYKGPIEMTLAVNKSGSINSLVINGQGETAGLGTKITGADFLGQFPGKAADPDKISGEVDAISGATVSSRAVISGVEQAMRYAKNVLGLEGKAGEVVTLESEGLYRALAEMSGTTDVKRLGTFEALGYPEIKQVYTAEYEGQKGYLVEMAEGAYVVVSEDGEVLSGEGAASEAASGYVKKYLAQGGKGA